MSQYKIVDPGLMVHPLRQELEDDDIRDFFRRIDEDDDSLTMDEIEAAQDWLYDYLASIKQTVYGTTVLQ